MPHDLLTQPSLLVRIRDARDAASWRQFVEIYAPLVYGFLRKQGLQDADAGDVAQDALRTVAQSIGQWNYDPQRGTFRGWLLAVVRSRLTDFHRRQERHNAAVSAAADAVSMPTTAIRPPNGTATTSGSCSRRLPARSAGIFRKARGSHSGSPR